MDLHLASDYTISKTRDEKTIQSYTGHNKLPAACLLQERRGEQQVLQLAGATQRRERPAGSRTLHLLREHGRVLLHHK